MAVIKSENEELKTPYYYLSKHRVKLMGVSILWVVLLHTTIRFNFFSISYLNYALSFIKDIGYGGVDIFLLISGMGIYNSLSRNSVSQYIKNRLYRIVPVWWTSLLISVIIGRIVLGVHYSVSQTIGYITFTGFWLDMANQGNWYAYAIMFFYLISPVLYSLIKESKNRLAMSAAISFIAIIISFCFFNSFKLIAFSRLPVYIVGMYFSSSLREKEIKKVHWFLLLAVLAFGLALLFVCYAFFGQYLWPYGLWWYPFIIIAPALALVIAKLFDLLKGRAKGLTAVLSVLGKSSLEVLITTIFVYDVIKQKEIIIINKQATAIIAAVCAMALGAVFHYAIKYALKKYQGRKREKND